MAALTAAQVAGAAIAGGFTGGDVAIAVAVAKAESGWDPGETSGNTNGSVDHGLWQINTVNSGALALGDWADPVTNAKMAMMVYKEQGWRAWTVYKTGAYLKYMPEGTAGALHPDGAPAGSGGTSGTATSTTDASAADTLGLGPLMAASTWLRFAAVLGGAVLVFVAVAVLSGAAGTALDVGNVAAKVSAL